MDKQKFGKYIADRRKELGYTQRELGDLVGISEKGVSKWERGLSLPDIANIAALADALQVEPGELLGNGILPPNIIADVQSDSNVENPPVGFYLHEMEKAVHAKKEKRRNTLLTVLSVLLLFVIVAIIFYRPMNGENLVLGDGDLEVNITYFSHTSTDIITKTYELDRYDENNSAIRYLLEDTTYHHTLKGITGSMRSNHVDPNISSISLVTDKSIVTIDPVLGIIDYYSINGSHIYKLGYFGKKDEIQLCSDILALIWVNDCEPTSETP